MEQEILKQVLQKLHLIKDDQKLIGDSETNSRGYQTTRLEEGGNLVVNIQEGK